MGDLEDVLLYMPSSHRRAATPVASDIECVLDELVSQLLSLARRKSEHLAMHEAGLLPFLVALVGEKQPEARKAKAAHAIGRLARDGPEAIRDALHEEGTVPPLVAMLHAGVESEAARAATFALANLACNSMARKATIFEAGAVRPLVALLPAGAEQEMAIWAAVTLGDLAFKSEARSAAIIEAGAVPPLVALLPAGADSARAAAIVLGELASSLERRSAAIIEAGAVPPLVALLAAGAESEVASAAACALGNLALILEAVSTAIIEAGAVPPLVMLFAAGACSRAAPNAAVALGNLVANTDNKELGTHATAAQVISTLRHKAISLSGFDHLKPWLQPAAEARLSAAVGGTDRMELKEALDEARMVVADDEARLAAAQARLDELTAAAAATKRARRESVGLGDVEPPAEFICPLTLELMQDPVVASDGHSYERVAIQVVLSSANKLSPLTRGALADALVPNRALRRRIEEHESELDRMAEQMAARMEVAAAEARVAGEAEAVARAEAERAAVVAAEAEQAAAERAVTAEAEAAALRQELQELRAARGEGSSSASAPKRGRDGVEAAAFEEQAAGRRTSSRHS